jgi:hypothetical protein
VPIGPSMCSVKRVSEANFGIPLQSSGRTLPSGKDSGNVVATFLLVETSTRCQQVYMVLQCLRYFQAEH